MQTTSDASAEFLIKLWPWIETNKNRLIGALAAFLIIIGIFYFMASQREQREISASQALTQLLVAPPAGMNPADALSQLATKYSGTQAANRAQLEAATSLFSAGRYADAQTQFQKFLNAGNSGSLASIAQLGVAASLEAQGKLDLAETAYQKVASSFSSTPEALPALCSLGRIEEAEGKLNEALNNYTAAAHAGQAGGTLAQEAALRANELKSKISATQKSPASVAPFAIPAK